MENVMKFQRTIKTAISVRGIGLHSGKPATLTLKPALPNQGIVFVRTDLEIPQGISAHFKNVVSTQLATTLGRGQMTISTVEHVLAALYGMGIDNAICEVDGPEMPILDGSSVQFCEAIERAGVRTQREAQPYVAIRRKVEVKLGEKWAVAEPSSRLEIQASVEWDHPSIGYQEYTYIEGKSSFAELAAARTFCLLRDVEMMKKAGLAKGGSLENSVVLDEVNVLNPGGFRFSNEIVRHKVLDALGDLKLAGLPMQAFIRLHRAGHDLHSQLLSAIFRDPMNYEIVDTNELAQEKVIRVSSALAARKLAVV
jgi:UDP-3-O-[3-hydroxymyristoyl] N-acetylglucosamine deacetylase